MINKKYLPPKSLADMLAEKIADRSGDGREYGFTTVAR